MFRPALVATRLALAAACVPMAVRAQGAVPPAPAPTPGPGPAAPAPPPAADPMEHFPFRHSWVVWDHSVSAQTVGIGGSYQSANPTYTMSGQLLPRYYLYDGEEDALYLDGRFEVIHEFTNSDVTTRRGETTLGDATLVLGYPRILAKSGDYATLASVRAPTLTLPTSKFSYENGTVLGLGAELRLAQELPLAGPRATLFPRAILRATVSYNHTFTRATTPTNTDLHRVRLDTDGRTVPGDQLTGIAFPEHEGALRGRAFADITNRLGLWFEVSYQPTWKYAFSSASVCTPLTGCSPVGRPSDPSRFVVVTAFQSELMFELLPELGLSLGYVNVATQPGPDGQRRSIFASPGAQIYLELTGYLDAMVAAAIGHRGDFADGHHLAL